MINRRVPYQNFLNSWYCVHPYMSLFPLHFTALEILKEFHNNASSPSLQLQNPELHFQESEN
jgi:hypothetical protein